MVPRSAYESVLQNMRNEDMNSKVTALRKALVPMTGELPDRTVGKLPSQHPLRSLSVIAQREPCEYPLHRLQRHMPDALQGEDKASVPFGGAKVRHI